MSLQGPVLSVANEAGFAFLKKRSLQKLFSLLNLDGHAVRVVGGAVRNGLIGEPVGDIDCATDWLPQEVMKIACAAGIKAIPTGIDHGTVTLVIEGEGFEVTSLRADVETNGRHAIVSFGSDWAADTRRRDFTMNALYLDGDGQVYDYIGQGIEDARARRVRFIGRADKRIAEDYLRILRFFRFFAQYGHVMDAGGYKACIAGQGGLRQLSAERVGGELRKLLLGPFSVEALEAMLGAGFLGGLLGAVPRLSCFKNAKTLCETLDLKLSLPLALACLSVEVREEVVAVSKCLRLSNRDRDGMLTILREGSMAQDCSMKGLRRLVYQVGYDRACDVLLYALAHRLLVCDLGELQENLVKIEGWQPPDFPLAGRDLIGLGFAPGPQMGRCLEALRVKWLDSDFSLAKEEVLGLAQKELEALDHA